MDSKPDPADSTTPARTFVALMQTLAQFSKLPDLMPVLPCAFEKIQQNFGPPPSENETENSLQSLALPIATFAQELQRILPSDPERAYATFTLEPGFGTDPATLASLQSAWALSDDQIAGLQEFINCILGAPMIKGVPSPNDTQEQRQIHNALEFLTSPDAFRPERFVLTPQLLSPPDGSIFSAFPRTTTAKWAPVAGATAYQIQIQYCEQQDCAGGGTAWIDTTTTDTMFSFDFVGMQPGRWRVASIDASGRAGAYSPWWSFVYTV